MLDAYRITLSWPALFCRSMGRLACESAVSFCRRAQRHWQRSSTSAGRCVLCCRERLRVFARQFRREPIVLFSLVRNSSDHARSYRSFVLEFSAFRSPPASGQMRAESVESSWSSLKTRPRCPRRAAIGGQRCSCTMFSA